MRGGALGDIVDEGGFGDVDGGGVFGDIDGGGGDADDGDGDGGGGERDGGGGDGDGGGTDDGDGDGGERAMGARSSAHAMRPPLWPCTTKARPRTSEAAPPVSTLSVETKVPSAEE